MLKRNDRWLTVIAAIAWFVLPNAAQAGQSSERAVREAAAEFYSALNLLFTGNLAPMELVWSHANDITYMGPGGGFEVGWTEVLADWKKQAAMQLGGKVEPDEMRITVGDEIAIVQNYEKGVNTNAGGKNENIAIRATSIFRKEQGKWKMIGHHTDLLPYLKH